MHERIVIELDGQRNVRCGVPAEREAGGVDASPDCRFRGSGPTEGRFPGARLAADAAAVGKPPFRPTYGDSSVTGPSDAWPLWKPSTGISVRWRVKGSCGVARRIELADNVGPS